MHLFRLTHIMQACRLTDIMQAYSAHVLSYRHNASISSYRRSTHVSSHTYHASALLSFHTCLGFLAFQRKNAFLSLKKQCFEKTCTTDIMYVYAPLLLAHHDAHICTMFFVYALHILHRRKKGFVWT